MLWLAAAITPPDAPSSDMSAPTTPSSSVSSMRNQRTLGPPDCRLIVRRCMVIAALPARGTNRYVCPPPGIIRVYVYCPPPNCIRLASDAPCQRPLAVVFVSASPSGGTRNSCAASDSVSSSMIVAALPVATSRRVTTSTSTPPSTTHMFSTRISFCMGPSRSSSGGVTNAPVLFTRYTRAPSSPGSCTSAASHRPVSSPN